MSNSPSLGKRVLAEFIGTFMFVFLGAGAAVGAYYAFGTGIYTNPDVALLIAALGNGLALGVAISATLGVSGGALNPAVVIGLLVNKKIGYKDVIPYILSELLGAILAVFILASLAPANAGKAVYWGSMTTSAGLPISVEAAIGLEAVMTFFLVFVVYGTIVDSRSPKLGGLLVGLMLTMCVFIGGPLTGAALNPARAMGPMIVSAVLGYANALTYWYVYWIGPILGALVAGLAWAVLKEERS